MDKYILACASHLDNWRGHWSFTTTRAVYTFCPSIAFKNENFLLKFTVPETTFITFQRAADESVVTFLGISDEHPNTKDVYQHLKCFLYVCSIKISSRFGPNTFRWRNPISVTWISSRRSISNYRFLSGIGREKVDWRAARAGAGCNEATLEGVTFWALNRPCLNWNRCSNIQYEIPLWHRMPKLAINFAITE